MEFWIWEKVKEQWRRPLVDICAIVIRCLTFDWDDGKTMQIQPSCPVDNLYSGFNFVVSQIRMKLPTEGHLGHINGTGTSTDTGNIASTGTGNIASTVLVLVFRYWYVLLLVKSG